MMPGRKTIFPIVIVIVLLLLALMSSSMQDEELADSHGGNSFFVGLSERLNDIVKVEVQYLGQTATVYQQNDQWLLKEKADYSANFSVVKALILSMVDLKIVEPKTSKAENYQQLGVQDISSDGSNKLISFFGADDKPVVRLIIGNVKGSKLFVRRVGEAQAWQVEGRVDTPASLSGWLDKEIINIAQERVKSIDILHGGKEGLSLSRTSPSEEFVLANTVQGSKADVKSVATNLSSLKLTDVYSSEELNLTKTSTVKSRYEMFNGLLVELSVMRKEDVSYLTLSASSLNDEAKKEAEALSQRWKNRVYVIPPFKADALSKKKSALLKQD